MSDLIVRASKFAKERHRGVNHLRKYTFDPYEVHLEAVASTVGDWGGTDEMIAAAFLHDVCEDTPTKLTEIKDLFGETVHEYVYYLTDASRPSDGNRATRCRINNEHLSRGPSEAHTIKLADIFDNVKSIMIHDPTFGKVYVPEKSLQILSLTKADPSIKKIIFEFVEKMNTLMVNGV